MTGQTYIPDNESIQRISDYSYVRSIGAYKPHFEGVPENYYPLNCKQITYATIILVLSIGAGIGILVGFIFWVQAAGLEGYTIAWVTVMLGFIVAMIIAFYFGGKDRIRMEKQLIAQSNRKQQEMIRGKKI